MRHLIVNADDLGLSPGVNLGIVEAHRQGIVTSASLMANLPEAVGAAALARENPGLGIGLHLNLSAGRPITDCPALTWSDGSFLPRLRVLLRVAISPRARREAWAEMDAQVEQASSLGVALDHLDSHHHIHLLRPLRRRAIALAFELGVPMRLPAERLSVREWLSDREAGLASFVAGRVRRKPNAPPHADHTRGLRLHRTVFDWETLARELTSVPDGITELICHPGHADDELGQLSRYRSGRENELAALVHPGVRTALHEAGIRLSTWKEAPLSRSGYSHA